MTLLEDLPAGPQLRPDRGDADKTVLTETVRVATSSAPARLTCDREHAPAQKRPVRRRAAVISVLSAAAAVLAIALVVVPALRAPSGPRPSATTQGRHAGSALTWRLVGDLSAAWRVLPGTSYEPDLVPFSCPTSTTCYADVLAVGATESEIAVTHDGGGSWQESYLPVTLSTPAVLSCVDAETCAIVGTDASGDPTFLETADGGQTWSSHAGPDGLTAGTGMSGMACASATSCIVVPGDPVGDTAAAVAFVTHDGGTTWSDSAMPPGFSQGPSSLQCLSATTCIVGGSAATPTDTLSGYSGAIAYTTDAGASWATATVPADLRGPVSISCGSSSDCLAILTRIDGPTQVLSSSDGGATWSEVPASGLPDGTGTALMSLSCADGSECWVAGITSAAGASPDAPRTITGGILASTSDGGHTFSEAVLPQGVGPVLNVSCPSATNCYALASQTIQPGSHFRLVLLAYGAATSASS